MFERCTQDARRVIFFARREAASAGSETVEPDHLLLGLLWEDLRLKSLLSFTEVEEIRKSIASATPRREKLTASVEIALSLATKKVLAYCAEEAENLNKQGI